MAAFTATRFSELPLRNSLPLTSHSHSLNLLFSSPNPSFHILKTFCSVRTTEHGGRSRNPRSNRSGTYPWKDQTPRPKGSSAPWLNKWPPSEPSDRKVAESSGRDRTDRAETVGYVARDRGQNAIERIVLRLRNLGN